MLYKYNRAASIRYAQRWAIDHNPKYYNYENKGGDSTNFVSQCLYAGCGVMNYTPLFGWYYVNTNRYAHSWTGAEELYNFLIGNFGEGPSGVEVTIDGVMPGDILQYAQAEEDFSHSQLIVSAGSPPSLDNILVCAHSVDSLNKQLSSDEYEKVRFIHIQGFRR